jgi:hypothetical protein
VDNRALPELRDAVTHACSPAQKMLTLTDKRIVALGGTSGIGLAVAHSALLEGASVIVASNRAVRLFELHQLRVDGHPFIAGLAGGDVPVPAALETRGGFELRRASPGGPASSRSGLGDMARLRAVDHRLGEGAVFVRTFPHSVILTAVLGGLVAMQQLLVPWIIPR